MVSNLLLSGDVVSGCVTSQQTHNICITFIQCLSNGKDVGLTLYKCYANVLCLLGCHRSWRNTQRKSLEKNNVLVMGLPSKLTF